ncbi:MAG: DNA-3-methyladenine glycosylase I, partial [Alphaproteobacteria bacterium]
MSGYCAFAQGHPVHGPYHDHEYGVPSADETVLFERLCLEIFQAGLSWELVLKRRSGMREALDGFSVDSVAAYDAARLEALMADSRVVRNRLKLAALVHNAQVIQSLRFKRTFRFTGGEITGEFLLSLGYLPGAHASDCPAPAARVATPWRTAE